MTENQDNMPAENTAPVTANPPQLAAPPTVEVNSAHTFFAVTGDELAQLHKAISAIAPVCGVSGAGPDMSHYRVDFEEHATEAQVSEALAFLQNWPEYKERQRTIAHNYTLLESWFNEQIAAGCLVSAGFTLGLTDSDVTLLTGNYVLAQAAVAAGMPLPPIIDKNQAVHAVDTIENFTAIMLEYGNRRAALAQEYAQNKAVIDEFAASAQ
jgi:hypothetical protein